MTTTLDSDLALQSAIIEELKWTPSVDRETIGVSVNRGAVTLSGEVDSYPEKRDAEQAVLSVRGVRAVAEQITVRSLVGSNDTDIAREANEALERAVDVPEGSVNVSVHAGVIALAGVTQWQYQRLAAERAVRYLRGVSGVVNKVTIGPVVSTSAVHTAIKSALERNAGVESEQVTVTAAGGEVTLAGQVRTWAESHAAEWAAWSAPGVTHVSNHIAIKRR